MPTGGLAPPPIMSYGFRWTASPRALASSETLPGLPSESEGEQVTREQQQQLQELSPQQQQRGGDGDASEQVAVNSPRTPQFELPDLPASAPAFVQEGATPGDRDADEEDEVEGLGVSLEDGVRLDADGVVRDELEEPSSPDKAAEQTVWPGR